MCISVWLEVEMESDIKCGFVCLLRELFLEVNYFKRKKDFIFLSTFVFSFIYFIHSWFQDSKKSELR